MWMLIPLITIGGFGVIMLYIIHRQEKKQAHQK